MSSIFIFTVFRKRRPQLMLTFVLTGSPVPATGRTEPSACALGIMSDFVVFRSINFIKNLWRTCLANFSFIFERFPDDKVYLGLGTDTRLSLLPLNTPYFIRYNVIWKIVWCRVVGFVPLRVSSTLGKITLRQAFYKVSDVSWNSMSCLLCYKLFWVNVWYPDKHVSICNVFLFIGGLVYGNYLKHK